MTTRRTERILTALAVAWLVTLAITKATGVPAPADVASSPDQLLDGHVWRLLSSGLVTDSTYPPFQIALLALITFLVIDRFDAVTWWIAALAGHVGSALIAYATIWIGVALGSTSAAPFERAGDFGASCVLCALNGVLLVSAIARIRAQRADRTDVIILGGSAALTVTWFVTLDWYGAEHLYALGIGALVGHSRDRSTG